MYFRRSTILAGGIVMGALALASVFYFRLRPTHATYRAPLLIYVEASYPGADARTVSDTIALPIEEQVNGVEGMLSMSSLSGSDGRYTLQVTFKPGTDLDMAQVLVQNRVSLALPLIPLQVQQEGVTVRKRTQEPLLLVSLTSTDKNVDAFFLSNFATNQIKDELRRLAGVGDVVLFGQRESRLLVTLEVEKLATFNLTITEVIDAISQQNIQVERVGLGQFFLPKEQQFQLSVNTHGRLVEPEEFGEIILKTTVEGRLVRLKDVARVQAEKNKGSSANLNGRPALVMGIYPLPTAKPSEVSREVQNKLAQLRLRLPEKLALSTPFDFTMNLEQPNDPTIQQYLVIDLETREDDNAEFTASNLERASKLLRVSNGVQDLLALTEHPFSLDRNRPCLIVRLLPKRDRELSVPNLRDLLQKEMSGAVFRISLPTTTEGFRVYGFPIEFVIEDRGNEGPDKLGECAKGLIEKMHKWDRFTDAALSLRHVPVMILDVDQKKCRAFGLEINEIYNTLQAVLGPDYIRNITQFGDNWQITIRSDLRSLKRLTEVPKLLVKDKENQAIPLVVVVKNVRDTFEPRVIERHNLTPVARFTANLAKGVSLAKAKALCESLAEESIDSKQFKLIWLSR